MSDQDNLRDRTAEVIDHALRTWMNDSNIEGTEQAFAAQAIVDEFGLREEARPGHNCTHPGCNERTRPAQTRIVGKWEKQ